jgi:hypothetical protein
MSTVQSRSPELYKLRFRFAVFHGLFPVLELCLQSPLYGHRRSVVESPSVDYLVSPRMSQQRQEQYY